MRHSNRLLASLSGADYSLLRPHFETVQLRPRTVLAEVGEPIHHLYFPHSAVICLMAVMRESRAVETATIGPEGVIGFEMLWGETATNRTLVQVSGEATRIRLREMATAVRESSTLRALLLRYVGAFLVQVTQSVACNGLHKIEERCCRWLLMTHDRAQRDSFPVTQDFLAEMLGVRRPTITFAARALQASGLIRYSRGVVSIVDRRSLEKSACECYAIVRRAYDDIFI